MISNAEDIVLKAVNPQGFKLQGTIDMHDLHIKVENRKGSVRSGKDPDGKAWSIKMTYPYGYISRTKATDDEHVDCYVGDNRKSEKVFVVHQVVPATGKYDEDKCMLGFDTAAEAKKAYLNHYDSPKFFGSMTTMTIDQFKESLKNNKGMKLSKAINIIGDEIEKAKKLPVGTISHGRKKIAEGKWVDVKDSKSTLSDARPGEKDSRHSKYNYQNAVKAELDKMYGETEGGKIFNDKTFQKKMDSEYEKDYKPKELAQSTEKTLSTKQKVDVMWGKFEEDFKDNNLHSKTLKMPNSEVAKKFKADLEASSYSGKFQIKEGILNKLKLTIKKKDKESIDSSNKSVENKLNVATVSVKEARTHAEAEFKKAGMDLNKLIPNFDKNYKAIQDSLKGSLDISRSDMPVVTQANIGKFKEELNASNVKAENKSVSVDSLKPIQSQIWLDKLISNIVEFGMPNKKDSPVLNQITISSKTGHIADGHHRYGQAMLVDPKLKMKTLEVDMDIKKLLKVAKAFGVKQGTESRS